MADRSFSRVPVYHSEWVQVPADQLGEQCKVSVYTVVTFDYSRC